MKTALITTLLTLPMFCYAGQKQNECSTTTDSNSVAGDKTNVNLRGIIKDSQQVLQLGNEKTKFHNTKDYCVVIRYMDERKIKYTVEYNGNHRTITVGKTK